MKKSLYPALLSIVVALFSLVNTAPAAFAASGQATMIHREMRASIRARGEHCYPHCSSTYKQYFHGNSYSHLHLTFHGSNGDNSGNQGNNLGRNVNYSANGGNLAVNHGRSRYANINQHFTGNSYSLSTGRFIGHNFDNSGNQGRNSAYNVNYGANGGNLIVNQGRPGRPVRVNQYFAGNSYSHEKGDFIGHNENNTGNQGWNSGNNEDHGANGGNQIVN